MNHYQKLAIVVIRVIGCCTAIFGLIGLTYGLALNVFRHEAAGIYFYSSLGYGLSGLVLFALSKPLAALIARKL